MIANFENQYLEILSKAQLLQWENYCLNVGHDLCEIDEEIYKVFQYYKDLRIEGRRGKVIQTIIQRGLVDKHPQVTKLRNKLDDYGNYGGGNVSRDELASKVTKDVLALMELRNSLAKAQGYGSYFDLVMSCEELNSCKVRGIIEDYLGENLDLAREIIGKHDIKWATWFKDLAQLQTSQSQGLSIQELAERLGFGHKMDNIQFVIKEQPIAGVAIPVNVPEDVRVLLRPGNSLSTKLTMYHELGHGLGHACNKQGGVFKTWSAIHDETMAVVVEHFAMEFMEPEVKKLAQEIKLMENVRCSISFLFECDLLKDPERAQELYLEHYGKLVSDPNPRVWALDTFRSLDPVYIHNYVLADIIGRQAVLYLQRLGLEKAEWGRWLKENWFATGRSISIGDKVSIVGIEVK